MGRKKQAISKLFSTKSPSSGEILYQKLNLPIKGTDTTHIGKLPAEAFGEYLYALEAVLCNVPIGKRNRR